MANVYFTTSGNFKNFKYGDNNQETVVKIKKLYADSRNITLDFLGASRVWVFSENDNIFIDGVPFFGQSDEIINKLQSDFFVEAPDGGGASEAYVNSKFLEATEISVQRFLNLQDLILANVRVGQFATTDSYYPDRDGGAATYKIVNDDSIIEDGGAVINLNNGLKAVLIPINGEINLLQFGAISCNYWSSFYDSTIHIQAALNFASKYVQTQVQNTNYYAGKLLVNGTFFTKELILTGSCRVFLYGYDAFRSVLMYCGDSGYKGDGIFNDESYILKIDENAYPFFQVERVGFNGLLSHQTTSNIKSIANYGLRIDNYYDWNTQIRHCHFKSFVNSGLWVKNDALNIYLDNVRFDCAGKDYIKIQSTNSFKLNDYTIDSKFHNFNFLPTAVKNLWNGLDYFEYSNIDNPAVGNCVINIDNLSPNASIIIDCARVEGGKLMSFGDNKSCFLALNNDTQFSEGYRPSIAITNHNFALQELHCILRIPVGQANANRTPKLEMDNVSCNGLMGVIPIWSVGIETNGFRLSGQEGFKLISPSKVILTQAGRPQNTNDNDSIIYNGKQITVGATVENGAYFKYNDINFLTNRQDGTLNFSDTYNTSALTCIRPLMGYGLNVANTWFPSSISGLLETNKTIETSSSLMKGASYTITYPNSSIQDVMCTESLDQGDGTWLNTFYWQTLNNTYVGQTISINITKCEWRAVGRKEPLIKSGTTVNRPSSILFLQDMYWDTDKSNWSIRNTSSWTDLPNTENGAWNITTGAVITTAVASSDKTGKQVALSGKFTFASSGVDVNITLPHQVDYGCTIVLGNLTFVLTDNSTSATVRSSQTGVQGFQINYKTI